MHARIVWIVAGIGATGAFVAWMILRGDGTSGAGAGHPDRGTAAVSAGGGGADGDSTSGPHRNIPSPRVGPGTAASSDTSPATPTLAQAASFDTEPRDDSWASATEGMLRDHLAGVAADAHVKLSAIECRTHRCRVRVEAPDQNALGLALSKLGEPGGLYGVATQMVISAPQPQSDGTIDIDVYGEFAR